MDTLILAVIAFVGSHIVLASNPIRPMLVEKIGLQPFRGIYSLISLVTLVWMIRAYGDADYVYLYDLGPGARHGAYLIMLLSVFFLVTGYTAKNPMALMTEKSASMGEPKTGILTITRHPVMVGVALWAFAHALVNGDQATLILTLGIAVLAIVGAYSQDLKKQREAGSEWGPMALTTSGFPFLAAIQGRTKIDWAGIGVLRVLATVLVFAVIVICHQWLSGVPLVNVL
ncbi:MAG: NnrU family protein [Alphaproteobacteria bacterium]|nr:NnrU family protein [Alphaproteobacteria bacterium]